MGEGGEGSEPCIVTAICQRNWKGALLCNARGVDGCDGGSLSGDEKELEATSAAF